jgi:adenylate cyclase
VRRRAGGALARSLPQVGVTRRARFTRTLRELDERPWLVRASRALRDRLPGDRDYGDPLSVAGTEPAHLIGQRLSSITAERPSALRELGLGALQVWQALSEAQGRGRGDEEVAILFTDLVGFSSWALEAGDDAAIELLRRMGRCVEPEIESRGGEVVKRLGDGLMAVFDEPSHALDAALAATAAVRGVEVDGHCLELRAGVHVGRPRRLGGDYLGVDVNTAARVAAAAGPNEVLVSEAVRERLGDSEVRLRRHWRFRAKGAPQGLRVYAAALDGASQS